MLSKETMLITFGTRITAVTQDGKATQLIDISNMPTDYANLFAASLLMKNYIDESRAVHERLLELLEQVGADSITPSLMNLIAGADFINNVVNHGVAAVAKTINKKV